MTCLCPSVPQLGYTTGCITVLLIWLHFTSSDWNSCMSSISPIHPLQNLTFAVDPPLQIFLVLHLLATEIVLSEYTEAKCSTLLQWLNNDPNAFAHLQTCRGWSSGQDWPGNDVKRNTSIPPVHWSVSMTLSLNFCAFLLLVLQQKIIQLHWSGCMFSSSLEARLCCTHLNIRIH